MIKFIIREYNIKVTILFCSINAHKGYSLSRRDDMESLGYMLIFLLKGQLPWQSLQFTSEENKIKQVGQMKIKMEVSELCKGLPIEFTRYLDYVRGLQFKSEPNYKYCQSLFKKVQIELNYVLFDYKFDFKDFIIFQMLTLIIHLYPQNKKFLCDYQLYLRSYINFKKKLF